MAARGKEIWPPAIALTRFLLLTGWWRGDQVVPPQEFLGQSMVEASLAGLAQTQAHVVELQMRCSR